MNKTITINLAGINFYIDEDAYTKLDLYLKAISVSLEPESRKETMRDIEARIAELFLENRKDKSEVIEIGIVDNMIAVMGQPEDYKVDEDTAQSHNEQKTKTARKLYRDIEHKVIGGVCSGLGYYFGISRIWVRIIFLILLFPVIISTTLLPSGSTILLIYVILWIVIPAARTTSEKLEMQGDKIDIDNIERKVREEYGNLKNKVENADYSGVGSFFETLGQVLIGILKIMAIIIGALIVLFAGMSLIAILISFLSLGAISIGGFNSYFDPLTIYSNMSPWLVYLLLFVFIGIPLFLLLLAGLKIMSTRLKTLGLTGILILIGIWVLSFVPLIIFGPNGLHLGVHGISSYSTKTLDLPTEDTLYIRALPEKNITVTGFSGLKRIANRTYSDDIKMEIKSTKTERKLKIYKNIWSYRSKKVNIQDFIYRSELQADTLFLDRLSSISLKADAINKQKIKATIYVPEGSVFYIDKTLSSMFTNIPHQYAEHLLSMKNEQLICLDCSDEKTSKEVSQDTLSKSASDNQTQNKEFNSSSDTIWYQSKH